MFTAIRFVFFAALSATVAWVIFRPDYDSIAAAVTALAAFMASFFLKKNDGVGGQIQNISGGVGIQAGGDVNIRDIK